MAQEGKNVYHRFCRHALVGTVTIFLGRIVVRFFFFAQSSSSPNPRHMLPRGVCHFEQVDEFSALAQSRLLTLRDQDTTFSHASALRQPKVWLIG